MEFLKFDKDFNRDDYINGLSKIGDEIEDNGWKNIRALEIGTGWGNSANYMLDRFAKMELISLDTNRELPAIKGLEDKFGVRFKSLHPDKFGVITGITSFNYIYIDGGHSYEEVKKDIATYLPLLADDGIIAFDDYGNPGHVCGVQQAVDELIDRSKFSKVIEVGNQTRIIIFVR